MKFNRASAITMVVGVFGTIGLYLTGFFQTHAEMVFVIQMVAQALQALTRPALQLQPPTATTEEVTK